jgi:TonB family protein
MPPSDHHAPHDAIAPLARRTTAAALASIGVHALVFVVSAVVVAHRWSQTDAEPAPHAYPLPSADDVLVVELPQATDVVPSVARIELPEPTSEPQPSPPSTGATVARVDTGRAGTGGDPDTVAKARNLAPRVEEDTVTPAIRDDVQAEQENRLATGDTRRGWVDRRRALQPMELTFVASGRGFRYERRAPAPRDATSGVAANVVARPAGGALGAGGRDEGDGFGAPKGGVLAGVATPDPARGASWGSRTIGPPQLTGAAVVLARPHVDRGNPSVASDARGRSGDRRDADLSVADARRSVVATSTGGGERLGDGRGGDGRGGAPGAGGRTGEGSNAAALGAGEGPEVIARRNRHTQYYLNLHARLEPLLADSFPHDAYVQLRNGTLYVDITIAKDGRLLGVVVTRPSGVPGFDENVVAAIRAAGPFEPVPDLLGQGPLTLPVPICGGYFVQ